MGPSLFSIIILISRKTERKIPLALPYLTKDYGPTDTEIAPLRKTSRVLMPLKKKIMRFKTLKKQRHVTPNFKKFEFYVVV